MRRLKLYKNKGFIPLETKKSREKSRFLTGFTLIETLVAITVLTLALGGPMTLATKSIKDSLASKNKVIAFYLAHEAIEYVRNKRDSNFLYKIATGDFLNSDWFDGQAGVISSLSCSPLKFDSSSGLYSCSGGGANSIFTRSVIIDNTLNGGDEAKITATVEWDDVGGRRTVILTQNMFNLAP
ncbi:MAG: hypothetical protein AAB885_00035 [Patescibacteria group bacterium]|mgnify:FL=1